ncbi:hypothetical protein NEOKW01_1304 [Nematocida sp. AWRm80]|nr:hypothetical protein NEOKW01_1304 [Nematocida sp. AWRm80]
MPITSNMIYGLLVCKCIVFKDLSYVLILAVDKLLKIGIYCVLLAWGHKEYLNPFLGIAAVKVVFLCTLLIELSPMFSRSPMLLYVSGDNVFSIERLILIGIKDVHTFYLFAYDIYYVIEQYTACDRTNNICYIKVFPWGYLQLHWSVLVYSLKLSLFWILSQQTNIIMLSLYIVIMGIFVVSHLFIKNSYYRTFNVIDYIHAVNILCMMLYISLYAIKRMQAQTTAMLKQKAERCPIQYPGLQE